MGKYDNYAKDVLRETFGKRFNTTDDVVFSFGKDAGTGEVDATIDGRIAVEIGVGSQKQVPFIFLYFFLSILYLGSSSAL